MSGKMSLDDFNTTKNSIMLSSVQEDVIFGTLLGDASLSMNGNDAYYQITNEHKEYLQHIKSVMPKHMFSSKGLTRDDRGDSVYWKLYSRNFGRLTRMRSVWYPDSTKKLPSHIEILPIRLRHWYICDGHLESNRYPTITAKWLSSEEVSRIEEQISELIGDCNISMSTRGGENEYTIYIPRDVRREFFDTIGECPASAYQYKWR